MAYVRIDDGAMNHPKILDLSDKAFRLWVWGLCYAQMHLTDGYIPLKALPPRLKAAAPMLMAPYPVLWEVADAGFQVHDYCDWNDSKERVEKNRKDARDRIAKKRGEERRIGDERRDSSVENIVHVRSTTAGENLPVSTSVLSSPVSVSSSEERSGEKPIWNAESFMESFRIGWRGLYGYECSLILKPLQFSQLQQQIAAIPEPLMRSALLAFFGGDDAYVRRAKHPLGLFLHDPMRFVAAPLAPAPEAGKLTTRLSAALANINAEAK